MNLKITRSGPRTYLQIVQSHRDPVSGQPRQRHIATLGRLDELVDGGLDALLDGLLKVTGRTRLAALDAEIDEERTVFDRALGLGDVWLIAKLWEELGLAKAVTLAARRTRARIAVEPLVRAMVANRLCEPRSKLGVVEWVEGVSLPGVALSEVTHQNLLRAMDVLADHWETVEKALGRQLAPLFADDLEVVFYDITTVRVHGEGEEEDEVRAWGKAKGADTLERQYAVGVVQSSAGMPITHEVFPGNISEPKTVKGMVERLAKRFPIRRLVLVADRGMISFDNLEELETIELSRGRKVEYILAVPARRYREMTKDLGTLHQELLTESRKLKAEALREVEVDGRRLVVAHSPQIAKRSRRMRAIRLAQACRLARELTAKLDAQDEGKRRRGRPLTDNGARLALRDHLVKYKLTRFIKVDWEERGFTWDWDVEELKRELILDGKLVIVSNVSGMSAAELVERYKDLADIERGFRVLKSHLEIAPVHHRLPKRIRAHTMICFLALVLYRVMRHRLRQAKADLSPDRLLLKLKAIQRHSVKLSTGRRLAGVTTPTMEQRSLFELMGVDVPTRKATATAK
jgi:transposase